MQIRTSFFAAIVSAVAVVAISADAMGAAWTTPSGTTATFKYDGGMDTNGRFGSPTDVTPTGFVFEPTNFIAVSTNNVAGFVTDTMKVNVSSLDGSKTLTTVRLNELGDFSFDNGGVKAQGAVFVRVLDADYAFANRTYYAELVTTPTFPQGGVDGDGVFVGSLVVNLPAPAARISITFNNSLHANSAVGGSAFIQKKIIGDGDPTGAGLIIGTVPEPTTMAVIFGGLGFVAARRRKA